MLRVITNGVEADSLCILKQSVGGVFFFFFPRETGKIRNPPIMRKEDTNKKSSPENHLINISRESADDFWFVRHPPPKEGNGVQQPGEKRERNF
ncbi:hypothetical protein CEXT_732011 [Caerostris extrusa]|uniref:Ycf15 n=1 Tax=Caerostris extrusa TaxID=172846 RepID=A0AAV4T529_CAEEX|nr:hypothetical protein CEXT_732011 [Caerostris extrusa]